MENRIDIDLLLELLDGTVEITTAKPEFCVFPLLGIPWELLSCSVSRMSRQSRKLIGAHLQVIETTIYNEVTLPYSIHKSTCFLCVQLRGNVGFEDANGEAIAGSTEPCISLCYYPSGEYFIRFRPGFHSLFIVSFEEEWPFNRVATYPAFAKLIDVWLALSDRAYRLSQMPISRPVAGLLDEIRLINIKWMQDSVRILHLLGKIIYAYHEQLVAYRFRVESSSGNRRALLDDYLEQHYRDTGACAITAIKKVLGLSRKDIEKLAKGSLGCTLRRYVVEFRIGKACLLLSETDLKILDIACQTGFSDLAHFTKSFRRSMGMYPSAYRTKHS